MSKIRELIEDIKKVRNDLVAQSNPQFHSLTTIIYKCEIAPLGFFIKCARR